MVLENGVWTMPCASASSKNLNAVPKPREPEGVAARASTDVKHTCTCWEVPGDHVAIHFKLDHTVRRCAESVPFAPTKGRVIAASLAVIHAQMVSVLFVCQRPPPAGDQDRLATEVPPTTPLSLHV
jgi:hypothetical protein